jgi:hypothetical protein
MNAHGCLLNHSERVVLRFPFGDCLYDLRPFLLARLGDHARAICRYRKLLSHFGHAGFL